MKRIVGFYFLFLLLIAAPTRTVVADEVVLDNGDTLTGTVVHVQAGTLVLNTEYAGEVTIRTERVRRLTADEPLPVTLLDGSAATGTIFYNGAITGGFDAERPVAEMDLAEVENINVQPKPPIKLEGRANVGITSEKGNTDTEQVRLDAELIARTEKQRFSLGGEYNKEQVDAIKTAENWNAYGLYDYFLDPKWFLNANSLFEHDEFADLELRTTLGAGAGYQFFESEELNLSVSAGLAYVFEDYIIAADDQFPGAQWIVKYDQFLFDKIVQLFHSNNGYISLENGNQWIINTRQGLRFPLIKGLVATFQYNYDYQNDPSPDATSKWDSKFMILLGYKFGG
ncbi:MAG: DUF481 domain-containing protein [Desulfosarcina sp.]